MRLEINEVIYKKILDYCKLNNIKDIKKEINELIQIGYNVRLYGDKPPMFKSNDIVNDIKEANKEEIVKEERKEEIKETVNIETNNEEEKKPRKKVRIIKN